MNGIKSFYSMRKAAEVGIGHLYHKKKHKKETLLRGIYYSVANPREIYA